MEVELIEIRDFMAQTAPFDQLPAEALQQLPKQLSIRYLRRGTPFPPADAEGSYLYIVRRGAVELRDQRGELIDKFAEGELFTDACVESDIEQNFSGFTVEDSLFYLLPCHGLEQLRQRHEAFNAHFTQSQRERLRHAVEVLMESPRPGSDLMTIEVSELISRTPVTASPTTSIRGAAQLMSEQRVSALLIMEANKLTGLITDRDLRTRCIAEGLSTDEPVSAIMTRKLVKIAHDTPGFEALLTMTRLNVHHLPVVNRDGVQGIITNNDLIRYQSANAIYLVSDVRKCHSLESLSELASGLPELQLQMINAGVTAHNLGQTLSTVTDAVTQCLLNLAEKELGPPPVHYAWLAAGSHARREQTVHSDQDSALLIADDYQQEHAPYFTRLAEIVTDGLNRCGFFYCPGEVMARNPTWRQPYRVWRSYFNDWITKPERKSLMLACNFFDMRVIHGDESLYDRLHADVLRQSRDNKIFLAHMAANAIQQKPPLGFFRNFVLIHDGEHDNTFNLKHRGIIPIVDLARVYALSAGVPEINTVERLHSAADAHTLSAEGAENLEDALEFIATLRARHQAGQIRRGLKADNYVTPDELSQLERSHLKDAFSIISTMQDALEQRYQTGRFYR